jgi:hypothetical protein
LAVRILAGAPMTISPDAVRAYEQELLQKTELLVLGLKGLAAAAPEHASTLIEEIVTRLRAVASSDGIAPSGPLRSEPRRVGPVVVAARGGGADDTEDFILDILAENPPGLSVQDIVDSLDAAQLEIKRKTLVVRLHRMAQAGRISPQTHGHYTLSEAERSRRRA